MSDYDRWKTRSDRDDPAALNHPEPLDDTERFDVWQYFPDDWHEKVGANLSAKDAVELAASYTRRPAALIGIIRKVHIIERESDAVAFEWKFGEGITFPPECRGRQ